MQRGDIRLFVAFRPGENVANEVSFTGGYPFREGSTVTPRRRRATASPSPPAAGDAGEWAWTDPADDSQVVAALRAAPRAKLTGTSSRGTDTEDTFSLVGLHRRGRGRGGALPLRRRAGDRRPSGYLGARAPLAARYP